MRMRTPKQYLIMSTGDYLFINSGCSAEKWHLTVDRVESLKIKESLFEIVKLIDSKMIPLCCINIPFVHLGYVKMLLQDRVVNVSHPEQSPKTADVEIVSRGVKTGRSVKVVAGGIFNRRKWVGIDCVETTIELWREQVRIAKEVDLGVTSDTIFIFNKSRDRNIYSDSRYREFVSYMEDQNNTNSYNGKIYFFTRENVGISYGGFSEVFDSLKYRYDYWYFNEDDYVIDTPNRLSSDIKRLADNFEPVGYVASSGVCQEYPATEYPTHVHFGMGLSSRNVLKLVCANSLTGKLPYFDDKRKHDDVSDHERYGEIPFTNAIYNLGYDLVTTTDEKIFYEWNNSTWSHVRIRKHER